MTSLGDKKATLNHLVCSAVGVLAAERMVYEIPGF